MLRASFIEGLIGISDALFCACLALVGSGGNDLNLSVDGYGLDGLASDVGGLKVLFVDCFSHLTWSG